MTVSFDNSTVLNVFTGTSKKGTSYGRLKFITPDFDVFEIPVFGENVDAIKTLTERKAYDLRFELVPGYNGGVNLVPAW